MYSEMVNGKPKETVQPYDELHQQGHLSVENNIKSLTNCDFGVQIASDGRIWICVDGQAFIRFKPTNKNKV